MSKEGEWHEGMPTHETILFSCFGGLSNTGITSALACLEVVKELGLEKVAIGCLPSVPLGVKPVLGKAKAAKKIITVDGCPFECARKTIEAAGFKIDKSIVLARDIGMKKVALHTDIGKGLGVEKYVSNEDIRKAKELIIKALLEKSHE
ncbi:MAG: putative zinc-binding protein [Candidatus Bathyarchaeia archaeon]